MGLDYRVVIGCAEGQGWVLRIPRRPGLHAPSMVERRVLELVAPALSVPVPDWRIHTPELIAYPLLPGSPGLTIESGEPIFHIDIASLVYAESMGDLLYELHAVNTDHAATTGVPVRSPEEVRAHWATTIEQVAGDFTIADALIDRWRAWLDDDSYWPGQSVLTHGEIYPAHTLIDGERITAVLDWTTAEVGDPARDFAIYHSIAPPAAFRAMADRYVTRGGEVWPRLEEHCIELMSTAPLSYALYALQTGDPDHRAAAQAGLAG
ncbi:aminoglycoside phosphotransferase [Flaviflexus salsibiostraticola]|uniref:Aminoglycoside phosphotransferase n=2 Tax=Flaviflexus salsibiostraticola TaxID=1282737 RepID=A0A3Q8WW16_9ACTO|nr:aminoglycoside phosphotransferase [Flaviflexus salsibiostraticola]